jgi:DNA-binding response OmpR family regulator
MHSFTISADKAGSVEAAVLIIEDEALIRWSLRSHLQALGVRVLEAESGGEALCRLNDGPVCAVLLDLKLGDADGIRLLREIRRVLPDCPVWIMTAHDTLESRREAENLGVHEFLNKPFNYRTLAERVLAVIGN